MVYSNVLPFLPSYAILLCVTVTGQLSCSSSTAACPISAGLTNQVNFMPIVELATPASFSLVGIKALVTEQGAPSNLVSKFNSIVVMN